MTAAAAALAAMLAVAAPAVAARASRGSLPGRRVERIAAGGERLYVLQGGEVLTFDGDGNRLGRCAGFAAPARAARRAALGAPDVEEVLRAAELPDDDSTPEAEDALADEGLGPTGRRRPQGDVGTGMIPRALAADGGPGPAWIATSSGMFQGDEQGCRPAGLDGRDLLQVAVSGEAVVAATADLLFRRVVGTAGDPGAASFTVAAGLTGRPRALAVWADGTAIVADDDGVARVGGDGTADRILDRPTDALMICGDTALALADDGVYRWTAGSAPLRASDRPPVRALACGAAPTARFVATGLGVWTSPDAVTWTERRETLGRSVAGAATVGGRTWLATEDGLDPIDLSAADDPAGASLPPADTGLDLPPAGNRHLGAATLPWPWITAVLGAQHTKDRRAWQVMLVVTFPLGRVAGARLDVAAVAAESARRDQLLARAQTELGGDGGDGDAERRALLESVLQEREALR
ncbi:MAG TPA: hypothetical protein VKZ18_20130 [Polyangia bacterium]|nr:hypothetical protein [Polyangia bacterium]